MGLDGILYAINSELDPNNLTEDELDDYSIMCWRKDYTINSWMHRLYQKKTGIYGNAYKIFNRVWLELNHEDLRKLKNDIICSRVRKKDYIYEFFGFVDIAMAKIRKGKRVYYLMDG